MSTPNETLPPIHTASLEKFNINMATIMYRFSPIKLPHKKKWSRLGEFSSKTLESCKAEESTSTDEARCLVLQEIMARARVIKDFATIRDSERFPKDLVGLDELIMRGDPNVSAHLHGSAYATFNVLAAPGQPSLAGIITRPTVAWEAEANRRISEARAGADRLAQAFGLRDSAQQQHYEHLQPSESLEGIEAGCCNKIAKGALRLCLDVDRRTKHGMDLPINMKEVYDRKFRLPAPEELGLRFPFEYPTYETAINAGLMSRKAAPRLFCGHVPPADATQAGESSAASGVAGTQLHSLGVGQSLARPDWLPFHSVEEVDRAANAYLNLDDCQDGDTAQERSQNLFGVLRTWLSRIADQCRDERVRYNPSQSRIMTLTDVEGRARHLAQLAEDHLAQRGVLPASVADLMNPGDSNPGLSTSPTVSRAGRVSGTDDTSTSEPSGST